MKYTQHSIDKLEELPSEVKSVIRYERGTFPSGTCNLEARQVVVLNKFLQPAGRISALLAIRPKILTNHAVLSHEGRKTF